MDVLYTFREGYKNVWIDGLNSSDNSSFGLTRFSVVTNKMSEEIPVIPKVTSLTVHSGNIVNWNRLKRHPNHGATAEVKTQLFTWSKNKTGAGNAFFTIMA